MWHALSNNQHLVIQAWISQQQMVITFLVTTYSTETKRYTSVVTKYILVDNARILKFTFTYLMTPVQKVQILPIFLTLLLNNNTKVVSRDLIRNKVRQ